MRGRAIAVGAGVLAAGALVLAAPWNGDHQRVIQAEFKSASGLVSGADVRVDGAPAGTVKALTLTPDGRALVSLQLDDGIPAPRADATAAIRPVDLIGDNYVALSVGTSASSLHRVIPPSRTLDEPRLDQALKTFGPAERAGLKTMLVEGGIALDERGADLNQAALALRPTLAAADRVALELGSQRANLSAFVRDAERVGAQAAARNEDLGRLVDGLDATLAATRDTSKPLSSALAGLPVALRELRTTAGHLQRTAGAALPLARSVRDAAPGLSRAAELAPAFLTTVTRAATRLHPAITEATSALSRGDKTLASLAAGLREVTSASPALDRFLRVLVPAAPAISKGFFVNFPDEAAEPGTQPFDPSADPRRHYWRGAAVLTCQSFGVPIRPGCLQDFLSGKSASGSEQAPPSTSRKAPSPSAAARRPQAPDGDGSPAAGDSGIPNALRHLPLGGSGAPGGGDAAGPIRDLLDLVLGP